MKLKTVEVSFSYVIVVQDDATSEDEEWCARDNLEEAMSDQGYHNLEVHIEDYDPNNLPYGWTNDAIPYGVEDDSTIGDILGSN